MKLYCKDIFTFRYCDIATERLNVQLNIHDIKDDINKYLNRWKEVVIFYTLRLCLAPLIESVILMDRMLFLLENGKSFVIIVFFSFQNLISIFDFRLSVRNNTSFRSHYFTEKSYINC